MSNISHIIHKNSSEKNTDNDGPKIPDANDIEYGEIAINYDKGNETLFIKNSNNEIIEFVNKNNILKSLPFEFSSILLNLLDSVEIKNGLDSYFAKNRDEFSRLFYEIVTPPDPV